MDPRLKTILYPIIKDRLCPILKDGLYTQDNDNCYEFHNEPKMPLVILATYVFDKDEYVKTTYEDQIITLCKVACCPSYMVDVTINGVDVGYMMMGEDFIDSQLREPHSKGGGGGMMPNGMIVSEIFNNDELIRETLAVINNIDSLNNNIKETLKNNFSAWTFDFEYFDLLDIFPFDAKDKGDLDTIIIMYTSPINVYNVMSEQQLRDDDIKTTIIGIIGSERFIKFRCKITYDETCYYVKYTIY